MAEEVLLNETYMDESQENDGQHPPPYTAQPKASKVKFMPLTSEEKIDPSMKTIYLGLFSMICCLWPCGLIAVILGIQAIQSHYRGELHQTRRLNTLSKRFSIASIVIGILLLVTCYIILGIYVYIFMHMIQAGHQDPTPAS